MNNTQLDPGLSAMLAGTNLSIDPGALLRQQQQQQQQQPLLETDASSSRTTSTSSVPRLSTPDTEDDDFEEEDDTPKKPNTRSKNKMPAASSKTKSSTTKTMTATKSKRGAAATGTADKRRKRNLERNRAAASKCRQRKKQWQDGLERKKTELESRYKALHSESKELMEEVAQLKSFVMAHAACNDTNIDDWIRNEADNFVRRMSAAQMQNANATTGPPVTTVAASLAQMRSPPQGSLTATPPMNDTMNNMFAPTGSKAPFDAAAATNTDLRPGVADNTNQNNNIFNQDLLMVSSLQA